MGRRDALVLFLLCIILVVSCQGPKTIPEVSSSRELSRNLNVDIVVDLDSSSATDAELRDFFRIANGFLKEKSGTEMELMNVRRISHKALSASGFSPAEVLQQVYSTEKFLPEYIIYFWDDATSLTHGGYASSFNHDDFCNHYFFSGNEESNKVYIGVLNWNHRYNRCGYDYSNLQNTAHVSNVSIDGECRGRAGTPCYFNSDFGYYQCDDESKDNFYQGNKYNFVASTAVHELLHHFGSYGNEDHFATPRCDQQMGETIYRQGDLIAQAEQNFGMCPITFENFKWSYQACL